jgi:hypothetical protein
MSNERERFLEVRGLLPPVHEQLRLRAVAQRLARDVCHLEGEERKRNVALENKYRQLAARARNGETVTWPDE